MVLPRGYGNDSPGRISAGRAQLCGFPGAALAALTGTSSSSGISASERYTGPASSTRTRQLGSVLKRPASAPPDEPEPTTMTSHESFVLTRSSVSVLARPAGWSTRRAVAVQVVGSRIDHDWV